AFLASLLRARLVPARTRKARKCARNVVVAPGIRPGCRDTDSLFPRRSRVVSITSTRPHPHARSGEHVGSRGYAGRRRGVPSECTDTECTWYAENGRYHHL